MRCRPASGVPSPIFLYPTDIGTYFLLNFDLRPTSLSKAQSKCCMPCQCGRTHHNERLDWVEPTSLVMEITPSLGSPDPEYL